MTVSVQSRYSYENQSNAHHGFDNEEHLEKQKANSDKTNNNKKREKQP